MIVIAAPITVDRLNAHTSVCMCVCVLQNAVTYRDYFLEPMVVSICDSSAAVRQVCVGLSWLDDFKGLFFGGEELLSPARLLLMA